MSIEDKLSLNKFNTDTKEHSHLEIISAEKCDRCEPKPCLTFCPAGTYKYEDKQMIVAFENCLECGACRIACPEKNVRWNYPRAGFGLTYKYG